jgi:hypothetical protein
VGNTDVLILQMKKILLYSLLLLSAACVKSTNQAEQISQKQTNADENKKPAPATIVIDFLKWYRDHFQELNQITLVNQINLAASETGNYSVNFEGTEQYLTAFEQSGYVTSGYIERWQDYFQKQEQHFKATPQNEGPPEGFDFDFVFWSQDFEQEMTQLDQLTITTLESTDQKVTLLAAFPTSYQLKFFLVKQGDQWLIDQTMNGKE